MSDKTTNRDAHINQARSAIEKADRTISQKPHGTDTPLIRTLRDTIKTLIGEIVNP